MHGSHLDSRPALRGEQRSRNADRVLEWQGALAIQLLPVRRGIRQSELGETSESPVLGHRQASPRTPLLAREGHMRGQPTSFPILPAGLFRQANLTYDGPETRIGLQRPEHGVALEVDKIGTAGDISDSSA